MEKICNKCGHPKKEEDFPFKNKSLNKRSTICQDCQKPYKTKHYRNNKKQYYRRNDEKRVKINQIIDQHKKAGCSLCPEKEPCCLDFHHVDPSQKEMSVSRLRNFTSFKRLKNEIKKCILLCSNCHRKFHAGVIEIPYGLAHGGQSDSKSVE